MAAGDVGGILGGIGSLLSGMSNTASSIFSMATARSNARYQAALQRTNQQWAAQNLPSFQREGLEKAGYNPLLALGNSAGGATSAFQVGQSQGDLGGLGEGLEGLGDALKAKKEEEEQKKKEEHEQEQKDKLFNAQLEQIKATIENINTHSAQRSLENKVLQQKINDYNDPSFLKSVGDLFNVVRNPFSAKNWNNLSHSSGSSHNSKKWQNIDAVRNELFG